MKKPLLASLLLSAILLASSTQQAAAQTKSTEARGYIPWFKVQNQAMVLQTGNQSKPLSQDITLPNGVRVEYRTQSVVLTSGKRVVLQEGDMLSLTGDLLQKAPAPEAPMLALMEAAPSPAPAPAPVAPAPAHVADAPVAPAFTYRPTAPVNGKLRGVVELGASGFNLFIIRMDEKRNWKLEKSEFGNSLVMENMATAADIRTGLKAYIGQMLDFGVSARDIHFVMSSGAALSQGTHNIVKGLEELKYVVTTVTPEREGELGLLAALPPGFANKAFVLDLGSANSKIAWLEGKETRVTDSYGSKYYEKHTADAVVAADVKNKAGQVPANLRGTCFIIGGAPYELAKAVRQGQEPYTVLKPASYYTQLNTAKAKAGLNIYEAVAAATGCQQFVFGFDTNFTMGYLLSLP
ncbi:hypothetical protein Q3A66_13840 [Hymenobacter sp. BT770]|uniref:DUF6799 domain-containing protein n=1 Tax=Hymenobacter sp. BT770 TaxID=2886942 RepID=UPI001D10F06C|nr:DUF6799 domain-containing protein [Hymenobacter sp. BT770]MCC3153922.1 hypothetical protein [Hymenobacter sp. BT770]MDO3416148.1 hypothetical protein [Hymenobacter sp. BT770]